MITIKLAFSCKKEDALLLSEIRKQQSCCIRTAFSALKKDKSEKYVRSLLKSRNYSLVDSWFEASALCKAKWILASAEARENTDIIFGGKKNFYDRVKGKISKEEYKAKRILPLMSIGEAGYKGNRKCELRLHEKKIIIHIVKKDKRAKSIELNISSFSKSQAKQLFQLQTKAELKEAPYTVELTDTHVCLTFQEFKDEPVKLIKNRVLSIDMNPNSIGFAVLENSKVIDSGKIDLIKLNEQSTSKVHYETYHVAKFLTEKAKHYRCSSFAIEDLSIKSKNHSKGKKFNRLVNNTWQRIKLISNLTKRCSIAGIQLVKVHPAYSSVIGNNIYSNYPDLICAAIEIGRRCQEQKLSKRWTYPKIKLNETLLNQWKKEGCREFKDWKEVNEWIKNSKLTYRVPEGSFATSVFRLFSDRSRLKISELS